MLRPHGGEALTSSIDQHSAWQSAPWPLFPSWPASTLSSSCMMTMLKSQRIKSVPSLKQLINVEPFLNDLFAKALANVNNGSIICNVGAGEPAPTVGAAPAGVLSLSTRASSAEVKKVEAKKEESEEFDDDMGFGLFD
ncbi:60S acidic ribosomal protein P1 [Sciurus carolinensis]|uniref:60S acidic ribosomal protein P1 n=1 Tax=Sciurus carolinensis TaxID=30640 RepID=A0AA41SWG1_SCICA|nr:60S acidic ribosomal protein P1 [Sciurus carolinensis]